MKNRTLRFGGPGRSSTSLDRSVSEFNEFEPPLKSAKNRFQLSAGPNLEKLNTILNVTKAATQIL